MSASLQEFNRRVSLAINLDTLFLSEPVEGALKISVPMLDSIDVDRGSDRIVQLTDVYIPNPEILVELVAQTYKNSQEIILFSNKNWSAFTLNTILAEALCPFGLTKSDKDKLIRAKLSTPNIDYRLPGFTHEREALNLPLCDRLAQRLRVQDCYRSTGIVVVLTEKEEKPKSSKYSDLTFKPEKLSLATSADVQNVRTIMDDAAQRLSNASKPTQRLFQKPPVAPESPDVLGYVLKK